MMKPLIALVLALGAFTLGAQAQACNPPNPLVINNTQPCPVFVTVVEYDAVCNTSLQTFNIPANGMAVANPIVGGAFEVAYASDVPPPYPIPPCSAIAHAPWACCAPGPNMVNWNLCNTCGTWATINWMGGPGAPMIVI
ncbi:hypothetical protein KFE98_19380 [bacterium SCSIO 12741]|nr:hypothetical protein KFE98_19380 [bacterium SCSIO 12741]